MDTQIAINENELFYSNLSEVSFAERFKKAKMLKGLTQQQLAKETGLSRSTINELEAGYRDNITRDTLVKLISILDRNLICDDYLTYLLDQEKNIANLISIYDIPTLCTKLGVHRSTVERWRDGKYQLSRENYNLIIKLKDHD